ncbi:hypothetical protein KSP40_PGU010846 [Platanthera guangdongensis]|uniref:DUF4057 domain-containing protein n=1 Tax=Platanthera guangdongensis TaxID=2320717 RepID=A0ABR2MS51_9ASPA
MEKSTPVRNPHTSTADLLTWSETQLPPPSQGDFTARRHHKHSSGISAALFGGQMTEEEVASVNKRKSCSGSKLREITGSRIFASANDNGESDSGGSLTNPDNRTSVRIYQQSMSSISQISFSTEENVSPKKPSSLPEVAKQRELSGSLETESDVAKKQLSDAKCKELSGHDIFGPPPEILPRPLAARNLELKGQLNFGEPAPRIIHTSVKVSSVSFSKSFI